MRILVVEDNEDNLTLVTKVLRHRGYEVDAARTGLEALELVGRLRPDLILMDLGLPGMDGWETTRRLRAMDEGRSIPIVALTAHALKAEDRERAAAAGCTDYITKPFDRNQLLATLELYGPAAGSETSRGRPSGETAGG